jgi:pimeloyl-ACP methyl ester carboxylesterase
MTSRRLAISLAVLAGLLVLLAGVTLWRSTARAAAAEAMWPPLGQFVDVGGRKVHVLVRGTGPDLILIHGASGNLRDFTPGLVEELSDAFRVIALDRPGLGYSDAVPGGEAIAVQAAHLAAAARQLGVTDPILLGQSYGGAVALAWAVTRPEPAPRALVLVSSPSLPWPGKLDPWYRLTASGFGRAVVVPLASAFVPDAYVGRAVEGIFTPEPVPEGYADAIGTGLTLRRDSLAVNAAQVNALRGQIVAQQDAYPALTLPVELIHGDADTVVPLEIHAQPLARILPDAALTVIPGGGHMPHQIHPGLVVAAVNRAQLRSAP